MSTVRPSGAGDEAVGTGEKRDGGYRRDQIQTYLVWVKIQNMFEYQVEEMNVQLLCLDVCGFFMVLVRAV